MYERTQLKALYLRSLQAFRAKPASAKGRYLRKITVSSTVTTNGHGVNTGATLAGKCSNWHPARATSSIDARVMPPMTPRISAAFLIGAR